MNEAATRSNEDQHDRVAGSSSIRPPLDPAHLRRRQLSHDIHHELGTISLLAVLLATARHIGPDSRKRAELILRELNWLEQLLQAYEDSQQDQTEAGGSGPQATRLDLIAAEVVGAIGLSCTTRLELRTNQLTAHVDALTYWRALRNLVHNAVRAAGPTGTVAVQLAGEPGWTLTDIDDDGSGFAAEPPHTLRLGIVQDLVTASGGSIHFGRSRRGWRLGPPPPAPRWRGVAGDRLVRDLRPPFGGSLVAVVKRVSGCRPRCSSTHVHATPSGPQPSRSKFADLLLTRPRRGRPATSPTGWLSSSGCI